MSLIPLMAIHLARACVCGNGAPVPCSEAKRPLMLIRKARPEITGRGAAFLTLAARLEIDAASLVYCAGCGEAEPFTHTVVVRDGDPVEAMSAVGKFMEEKS